MLITQKKNSRAMTLIEVMVSVVTVAVVGLGILSGIAYGLYAQRSVYERNGAISIAAEVIEQQKRKLFRDLEPFNMTAEEAADQGFVVFDNNTVDVTDDITGTVDLAFYDMDGTELDELDSVQKVRAEVTVTWTSAGVGEDSIRLNTIMVP